MQKVLIVGEAPGADEEALGKPFVGASGIELARMCTEAGFKSATTAWSSALGKYAADWSTSDFNLTNVSLARPPGNDISLYFAKAKKDRTPAHSLLRDRYVLEPIRTGFSALVRTIAETKPTLIITTGNVPMWALTGRWGITKWRGSQIYTDSLIGPTPIQVIPILHPASILREWKTRQATVQDLRRAFHFKDARWPTPVYNFDIRPTFDRAVRVLQWLRYRLDCGERLRLSFDIETASGHITCCGVAWTTRDAICTPFTERGQHYWSEVEEATIIALWLDLLTHSNALVVGQNIIYDSQYTWKHWRFVPRVAQDTMISQHSLFSDLPKSLAFIASLYCNHYVFWKDEGKAWNPGDAGEQLWWYNCLDCTYTLECADVLQVTAGRMGLQGVHDFQQSLLWPVLRAMQLGISVDKKARDSMIFEVQESITIREQYLLKVLGHELNPDSPKQMHALFYNDLKLPVQMTRAKKGVAGHATLDDDAMMKLANKEPLIQPIVAAIGDIRTLRKFLSNFLLRRLDEDGRWRCSFNIGGSASGKSAPKTYRLSSSESAFDTGANLQNIPSDKSKSLGKAAARGGDNFFGSGASMPNIRSIFVPDPGYTWIELDLQRADLFVVCWEANDEILKTAMLAGADIHLLNAFVLTGKEPPPITELIEGHPTYATHRKSLKLIREFAKVFCHGSNYGGGPKTMAGHTGRSIAEVERAQRIWFTAHPGILKWHDRVKSEVIARRFVANKLSYRWYVFDRVDSIIPEAIAWGPQSTVAVVINRIWDNIFAKLPYVQVLAQVHDSLCMQCPTGRLAEALPQIEECAKIVIPYNDPLTIPVTIKTSNKSWGDC